jgi:hypothetical protein
VINLRPEADHPDRCNIVVDVGRVRRVLLRIAADIDELARVRSVEDLKHAHVDGDVRAGTPPASGRIAACVPRARSQHPPIPPSVV